MNEKPNTHVVQRTPDGVLADRRGTYPRDASSSAALTYAWDEALGPVDKLVLLAVAECHPMAPWEAIENDENNSFFTFCEMVGMLDPEVEDILRRLSVLWTYDD